MGRLDLAGRARAARAHGDSCEIEPDNERLGLDSRHGKAARVRQTIDPPRKHDGVGRERKRALLKLISQPCGFFGLGEVGQGKLGRHAKSDNARHVLRSRAAPPLLAAALDQGLDRCTVVEHERAHTLGTADLVGGEAQHVGAERVHIELDPSRRLNGIGVEDPAGVMHDARGLCDRLDRAGLIVGGHQRHEGPHTRAIGLGKLLRKDSEVGAPVSRDGKSRDGPRREPSAGEHGRMLHR
jgi:hypothetical protein